MSIRLFMSSPISICCACSIFFSVPNFEQHAQNFLRLSRAEFIGVNNIVLPSQRDNYTAWVTANYQDFIKDAHMITYGNLDNLDQNTSMYKPFVTRRDPETRKFVPDIARDIYYVRTTQSPALSNYGSVPSIGTAMGLLAFDGVQEVLISEVRPYRALSAEAHSKLHDGGVGVDHRHSFLYAPMYKSLHDHTLVGTLTAAIAWDASLRNLLPEEVSGVVCVIRNNCGQQYTYLIDGTKALYQGKGDLHVKTHDTLKKVVDLSWNTEEAFVNTPGHCIYFMVSRMS